MNFQDRLYKSKKFRFWLLLLLTGICSLLAWIITGDRSITGFVAVLMGLSFWAVIENQRRRIRRKKTGEEIDWRSITYTEWLGLPSIKPLPKDAVTFKRCKNKELDELRRSIQMMSNDPGNYHSGIWMVLAYKAASKYLELEPALPRDIEFSCKKFLAFTAWQKEIWMISSSEDEAPEGVFAYGDLFIQAGSNLSELIGKFQQWWKQHPGSKPFSKFDQTFWPMLEYLAFILEIQLRNSKPIES
jgi:hypothetical protein